MPSAPARQRVRCVPGDGGVSGPRTRDPGGEGVVTSLRAAARRRRQLRQSPGCVRGHDGDGGGRAGLRHLDALPDRDGRHVAARSLPRARRVLRLVRHAGSRISSRRQPRSTRCRRCMCRSPASAIRASISWTRSGPTAAASSAPGPTTRSTANTPTTRCWRWATSASIRRDGARQSAKR